MESENPLASTLWKQSSMAPDREYEDLNDMEGEHEDGDVIDIDPGLKLMYLVNAGDLDGIKELLHSGGDVNFRDIDHRTALHVAACQGYYDVAQLLLENGTEVDPKDRWGSTLIVYFQICSRCVANRNRYLRDSSPLRQISIHSQH